MKENTLFFTIDDNLKSRYKRLDQLIVDKFDLKRSSVKKLFDFGQISVKNNKIDISFQLSKLPPLNSNVFIEIPKAKNDVHLPENIKLDILFEDKFLIILNKPPGLVVHPAPGNREGTLVNALLYYCKDLHGIGHVKRPGIVHRLDKGTSGVMVVAKEQNTHSKLVDLFSRHELEREYIAICKRGSKLKAIGKIESLIARHPKHRKKMSSKVFQGKTAITNYKVLKETKKFALCLFKLETGRTHQIRVHASEVLNSPILLDPTYSRGSLNITISERIQSQLKEYPYPLLHAKRLSFTHPITKEILDIEVDPPSFFSTISKEIFGE